MTTKQFNDWIKRMRLTNRLAWKILGISEHTLRNYRRGKRAGGREVAIPEPIAKLCKMLDDRRKAGHDVIMEMKTK